MVERIETPSAMTAWADAQRRAGRIGLVPTMGFLHAGHTSLMDALRPRCDHLVASIFVNPLQFGAHEDLSTYPCDLARDLALCEAHGVDAVFAPAEAMYPDGFCTQVTVSGLTDGLCGASRPTHFAGVTTVVARLFGLTRCDVAIFGEKDWQQLQVLRRMVRDLGMAVEVLGGPIVREPDGLALSSRNTYLSGDERRRAVSLSRALAAMAQARQAGETDVAVLKEAGLAVLDVDRVDYLEVVDEALQPLDHVTGEARALVAAFFGRTRLIDNHAI